MSNSNPISNSVELQKQSSGCSSRNAGRNIVITLVALVAIAGLTVGILTTLNSYHLLPNYFHFIPTLPLEVSGVLIGSGGVLFTGLILYGIYCLASREKIEQPPSISEEPLPLPPPPQEVEVAQPEPEPLSPPPAVPPPPAKISVGTAMRLMKNYSPELAKKYRTETGLSTFLKRLATSFPEPEIRDSLHRLGVIQGHLENEAGSIEEIMGMYRSWMTGVGTAPFYFLTVKEIDSVKQYALITLSKAFPVEASLVETYLRALKEHLINGADLPDFSLPLDYKPSLGKLFNACIQAPDKTALQQCKVLYKIGLFRQVLADYPEWKEDPHWREWVASSLLYFKRKMGAIAPSATDPLHKEWEQAHAYISITHTAWKTLEPIADSISPIPDSLALLGEVQTKQTNQIPYQDVKVASVDLEVQVAPLKPPTKSPTWTSKEDLELIKQWHTYLFSLYHQTNHPLESTEYAVYQFLRVLPPLSRTYIKFTGDLTDNEKEVLHSQLYELGNLAHTLHAALARMIIHPSRLVVHLNTLDLLIVLTQAIPTAHFMGCSVDLLFVREALYDPYLDLGSFQSQVLQRFDSISKKAKNRYPQIFWQLTKNTTRYGVSKEFEEKCESDFTGSFIPRPVAHLQALASLLNAYSSPHLALSYSPKGFEGRKDFNPYMQGLHQHILAASQKFKDSRPLLSIDADFEVTPLEIKIRNKKEYKSPSYTLGPPVSPFSILSGPIRNQEIRNRLIEGMVACVAYPFVDMDGNFGAQVKEDDLPLHDGRGAEASNGLTQTHLHVTQEKFCFPQTTIEVSRELQLMASGRDNRAFNALHLFSQYPHLLSHPECREDFQHVFRLMIFRNDLLYRELFSNPSALDGFLICFNKMLNTYERLGDLKAWAFVYKAHADFIVCLRDTGFDIQQPLRTQCECTHKLSEWIESAEKGTKKYFEARSLLHIAYLMNHAVLGFDDAQVLPIGQSLVVAKEQIDHMLMHSVFEGQILFDLCKDLIPRLVAAVENKTVTVDQLLAYRIQINATLSPWERIAEGIYQSGTTIVNLPTFQIIRNGKKNGSLPQEIQNDAIFKALFGDSLLKGIHTFTYVTTQWGRAWHVALNQRSTAYALYLNPKDARFPLLFRNKEGNGWEQWIRFQEIAPSLPIDFREGLLWRGINVSRVEDPSGKEIYTPHFEGEKLTQLERHVQGRLEPVLDPRQFAFFDRLDTEFVVTQEGNTNLPVVTYLRCAAQYTWNPEKRRWDSKVHHGYFISAKPLEQWLPLGSHSTERQEQFFTSTFQSYQLLENEQGHSKLLLFYRPFQKCTPTKEITAKEIKYAFGLEPVSETTSPWSRQTIAVFDLMTHGHLRSKHPQDFLYLGYVLFSQGKYGEALLYLQRSQAVWTATDQDICAVREKIKNWFLNWPDPSPNAKAFIVKMLQLEHQLSESLFSSEVALKALDAKLLPSLLDLAHTYLTSDEKQVDPLFRLRDQDKQDLIHLTLRAPTWLSTHLGSPLVTDAAREYYQKTANPDGRLQWSLDQQIAALLKQVPDSRAVPKTPPHFYPTPLFDLQSWLTPITEDAIHQENQRRVQELTAELKPLFNGDSLADAIGREIALDMERHAKKVEESFTISKDADLKELEQELMRQEHRMHQTEKSQRARILHQFLCLPVKGGASLERQLKEQEASYNSLFEQARHCLGTSDFSSLVEMGSLAHAQIEPLRQQLLAYEIYRTDRQLVTRKRESVQRLIKAPHNTLLREECAALLQEWRQYDPESHPYAPILLLLEDELNIMARPSQIQHIHKLIDHPDAYIHEAMAGGKTTFLRNVFSAIETQKGLLAGVVTYSPLMAMHHKEYAAVNNLALGSMAYPLYYNRNAPHDVTALKLMIIYHLKALCRSGRIDQTPQTIISLNHTLTQLVLALQISSEKSLTELRPAINALQQLLRLRSQYLSVYSDEIDKIYDPMKDYNYSMGSAVVLQEQFYAPALNIIHLLMKDPSLVDFASCIKKNQLPQLSDAQFEAYLSALAKVAHRHFKLPFDETSTVAYLTERHQNHPDEQAKIISFYEETVLRHDNPDMILTTQMLHSFIGVLLRGMKNKLVGTDFGRSKDGISVKPYSFSAVCQESSQRSFVLSTVLEICIDYFVSGIGIKGAQAYVEKAKEAATTELTNSLISTIDQTKQGKDFYDHFSILLSEVKQADYPLIAQTIEASPVLFAVCLQSIILKNFTYYEEKIEGSAHHLPHLVAHFSGSSGSPERVKTLPHSIQKHESLVRQLGAIGSVFYALLKDFDPNADIGEVDLSQPVATQIAPHLRPGDTLIDNNPFFPGKKGIEIVATIAHAAPTLASYRFLDEEDDVCTWKEGHAVKGEGSLNLAEVVSIISHKGRQGTNWTFAKETTGFVEIGVNTEMTSFYQSLMRLRLLGKGQKARIWYDKTLRERWALHPVLQSSSLFAKLIWTLAHNESRDIQQLHFQANRKQIRSVRTKVIDTIKQTTTDVTALATIKGVKSFQLTSYSPLDPQLCGAPIVLGDPCEMLRHIRQTELSHLEKLKAEIHALVIDPAVKSACIATIDKGLQELSQCLIMDPRDLPEKVSLNHHNSDSTEEIEVEVAAEQAAQVEQAISLEVETDLEIQYENSVSVDLEETVEHPRTTEVGREWFESFFWDIEWRKHFKESRSFNRICYTDKDMFPEIVASPYSLAIYERNQADAHLTDKLWLGGRLEQAHISSQVLLLFYQGKATCLLASQKEADFFFMQPMLHKQRFERQWTDMPFSDTRSNLSKLSPYQAEVIKRRCCDPTWGQTHYDRIQNDCRFDRELLVFKADLRSTTIPVSLPPALHKEWVQRIALAKCIYAVAPLSDLEKSYLEEWLGNQKIPLEMLEKRLQDYLKRFHPNTTRNDLMELIKEQKTTTQPQFLN